ncbi:acyltransferase [Enterococcus ureilyticus]|uniref:acyltransferase n=1 Tax=Enterococcus ureilyticus TaxID=1131292 RepID=UPI001A9300AD|nr:acyltransferase [Enterococcus ureilyticus]
MEKEKIEIVFSKLLSIPKSIFWNFRLLPFKQALRLPLLFHFKTRMYVNKGTMILLKDAKLFNFSFGFGGSLGVARNKESFFIVRNSGTLKIKGKSTFAAGSSIRVEEGVLEIGANFNANKNCYISVFKKVIIGEQVLLGWNVTLIDNDGHTIDSNQNVGEIHISNDCWIAAHSYILKNVSLGSGNVVAARSLVTSSLMKQGTPSRSVIAGHPAKVIKTNIVWRE